MLQLIFRCIRYFYLLKPGIFAWHYGFNHQAYFKVSEFDQIKANTFLVSNRLLKYKEEPFNCVRFDNY